MHRFPLTRKLGLLAAAVLFVTAMVVALPTAQAACHNWTEYYTYYSDSTKTQEVGWCEFACYCVTYCEGEQTPYYRHWVWPGCL